MQSQGKIQQQWARFFAVLSHIQSSIKHHGNPTRAPDICLLGRFTVLKNAVGLYAQLF